VDETLLHPGLNGVLRKRFVKRGDNVFAIVGDKEIAYKEGFKIYLAAKTFKPELLVDLSSAVRSHKHTCKDKGICMRLDSANQIVGLCLHNVCLCLHNV
jgi:ATP-binding dynein motor region